MTTILDRAIKTLHNLESPSRTYTVIVDDKYNPGKKEVTHTVILSEGVPNTPEMAINQFDSERLFDEEVIHCLPIEMYEEISNYLDYKIKKSKTDARFEVRILVTCVGGKNNEVGQVSQSFNMDEDLINLSLIDFGEFENIIRNMVSTAKELYLTFEKINE